MGLGPNSGSRIFDEIDDSTGDAVMDRIFQKSSSARNFITILLDRRGDSDDPFVGQFTISEFVAGMESVQNEPKQDVVKVHKLTDENQHWQVYTDVDGVIGPDGKPIVTKSIVPKAPDGQLVAVVDSGFTFTQVCQQHCNNPEMNFKFTWNRSRAKCLIQSMVVCKERSGTTRTASGQFHAPKC